MMNIYNKLSKPIVSLAPMEDVTDTVFRRVISSVGKPDLFYTEFVNVEGLTSKGRDSVIHRLKYEIEEKPIIVQLWGTKPEKFLEASRFVSELGFDGIDINMGCSVKKVATTGSGSGLIKSDTNLVKDIILAVKEGSQGLPVSVKTRIGWDIPEIDRWIGFLLDQNLDALTVHGRTARGKGAIHANWDEIKKCVELRDSMGKDTFIFGNGDINSISQAHEFVKEYTVDGVMIGRASITNPWIFTDREDISSEERIELFKKHVLLFKETWGNTNKNFHSIKKFFRTYINGFEGASEIRMELMECNTVEELSEKIDLLLSN